MPTFQYTALTATGERVAGALVGVSQQAVMAELESRRLTPVSIREQRLARRGRRVGTRRIAQTYLQLADMLKAGVPLLRALQLLGNRRAHPRLASVFRALAEAVAEGEELADAMARHPGIFPRVHVAMVRAGERGGFLESVFARLGEFSLSQAELRAKIIGNLIYPVILVVFGCAVLGVVFGVFVPRFQPLFDRLERLPALTSLVFGASALVADYGLITLAVLLVGIAGLWRLARRPAARRRLAAMRTFMPVVGPIVRSIAAGRFCRTLGTLLGNGVPILVAMDIAREAAGNPLMEQAVADATDAVRAGEPLADPLARSRLFDDDVIEMISVAESANNLDEVLVRIAETIEGRVDRLLTVAVRLLEPLLLLVIAGAVVIVALALIVPMYQLSGTVR